MTRKRKHNPQQFTTDEAQTATLLVTEGTIFCHKVKRWSPSLAILMCDKEALKPAARVFRTTITADRTRKQHCRPELFPPDGRGYWIVRKINAKQLVQRLKPLLTQEFLRKWEKELERCR